MASLNLKQLAKGAGLPTLLDQVGLWRPLARTRMWLADKRRAQVDEREDAGLRLIEEDLRACREQIRRLASGVPQGDPRKPAWMISSFPTVWGAKLEGVLSLALRLKDFRVQVIELGGNAWMRQYHEAYGNRSSIDFHTLMYLEPPARRDRDYLDFTTSEPTLRDLMALTYRGVDVGRIVLSNVMYCHKFAQFDLSQPELRREVYEELLVVRRNVLAAERMLNKTKPALAMVLEKGLSPSAEIVGACIARSIPVVQYLNSQDLNGFVFKRFHTGNIQNHPFSLDPGTWERVKRMDWGPEHEVALMRDLEESYQSGTWFNRKFLHDGKQIKGAPEVRRQLGLDPDKKTAVIFSHVLWDATFFYGDSLFEDYETWLLESVRAACANPKVNWVIKLHPDLVWKLKYEGFTGELRDVIAMRSSVGELPPHVKLVMPDTDISTYSFFGITDYCLTVRGTIGIEMACHGVPVITAGTGRYSNLGFTVDAATSQEYLDRLAHIEDLPPASREQTELARRFAYALFKLRPWRLKSFETVKMPLAQTGNPLDQNLVAHVETLAQFAAAPDLRQFSDWVASGEIDFLDTPI